MASSSSPTAEIVREAIERDGLYCYLDSTIGKQVDEFKREGYPFLTENGLDFIKRNTLDDKRVREVLESFFIWSGLGLCQKFDRHPGRTFSLANYAGTQVRALMVQLWSAEARAVFYKGSHLQSLEKIDTSGLLEIPHEYLHRDTIQRTEVEIKDGALVILDDRLGFTIVQGYVITFCFAVEEELNKWAKMKLSNSLSLKKRVASMTYQRIGTNFEFPR